MKGSLLPFVVGMLVAFALGCGGSAPEAKSAEPQPESKAALGGPDAGGGGDKDAIPAKCKGAMIGDLIAALSSPDCQLPEGTPDPEDKELKDDLDVSVSAEQNAAPGSSAKVRVIFKNKTKKNLPLFFIDNPEPRFTIEVLNAKGAHADNPPGDEPSLPESVNDAPAEERRVARVVLAPSGSVSATLTWNVIKYKWATARAKGALPGRGYPRDPAGPLPKGKYFLRVTTPLVGIIDPDRLIVQPRTEVKVGG